MKKNCSVFMLFKNLIADSVCFIYIFNIGYQLFIISTHTCTSVQHQLAETSHTHAVVWDSCRPTL